MVGHHDSHELEVIDTALPPGDATVARIPLGRLPLDVAVSGTRALVPTFTPTPGLLGPNDGRNELLEVDLVSAQVVGAHLVDLGTDYSRVLESAQHVVVLGSGSGSVLIADPLTLALFERIDLAPGDPVAHPLDMAFIPPPGGGAPSGLFVVNEFRETVRPVDLSAGPPFSLQSEIGLGEGRNPRLPLIDLSSAEDGEWFFETVAFFNGTASNPNNVTCATCHLGAGSDGLNHIAAVRQAPPLFDVLRTGPWGHQGGASNLQTLVRGAFNAHGILGGQRPAGAADLMLRFFATVRAPRSPFRQANGSLSPEAAAGKLVFENQAGCAVCHSAQLFIPRPPAPPTIVGGVGTGLAPANVPALKGLWNTGPYLHDGSAAALEDVLLMNVGDQHGTTSGLSAQERSDLVAYLLSL